jgi:lactate dehydrogenase-like 2-hydroxyacid dehydrogenase
VDREALLAALRERKILGAGLDVFHQSRWPAGRSRPRPAQRGALPRTTPDRPPRWCAMGYFRAVANVEHFLAGKPTDVVVAPVK